MTSANGTALGINELISSILCYLPKQDLKSARRVNKTWASLGGQMLIGTLYISPREIDMAAFDGVTQHQDLSKSVKHLVYDTAQFVKLNGFDQYYKELARASKANAFLHLGTAHSKVSQLLSAVEKTKAKINHPGGSFDADGTEWSPLPFDDDRYEDHWSDPTFIDGYEQYLRYASESANPFGSLWSDRVARGLKTLSHMSSFTIENTWEAIYRIDDFTRYKRSDGLWYREGLTAFAILEDTSSSNINRLIESALIMPDGRRLVGSPSARAWHPTGVPPSGPISSLRLKRESRETGRANSKVQLVKTGFSDSLWELFEVLELLNAANKMPRDFRALNHFEEGAGIPEDLFKLNLESAVDFAANLRVLELQLVPCQSRVGSSDICLLQRWMKKAEAASAFPDVTQKDKLEVVSLYMGPHYAFPQYELTTIISNVDTWIRPNLTTLRLNGFCIHSRDLNLLLFVNLPKLRVLALAQLLLKDGLWDDVIEGMRQILKLKVVNFVGSWWQQCPGDEQPILRYRGRNKDIQSYYRDGGVHPGSPEYVPSQDFLEQIARWKELRSKNQ